MRHKYWRAYEPKIRDLQSLSIFSWPIRSPSLRKLSALTSLPFRWLMERMLMNIVAGCLQILPRFLNLYPLYLFKVHVLLLVTLR